MGAHAGGAALAAAATPRSTRCFGKALAKERDGALRELRRADRGGEPRRSASPRRPARSRRPRSCAGGRAILVAGLVVLAVAIAGGDRGAHDGRGRRGGRRSGTASPRSTRRRAGVAAFSETESAPGNVAVGEGAVWVLNTESPSVSQIDPKTKETVKTFRPGGVPSEIAAGEGAVWIGNAGGGDQTNTTVSVSRIDPDSNAVTRT